MRDPLLLIDKPVGFSSFQIVRILKKRYKKVGHAGTLDPFASGLLIILINEATKQFENIQKWDKEYSGEISLGFSTDTHDITGTRDKQLNTDDIRTSLPELNRVAQGFVGEIEQTPPRFSALKQDGRRLYQMSRQNKQVKLKSRKVLVESFEIDDVDLPFVRFKSTVGKGVYIRSLAHDLGNALGCGATLLSLRRVRIGTYRVAEAMKLGDIIEPGQC
jgi:tRNA pseudouridine55 synthase